MDYEINLYLITYNRFTNTIGFKKKSTSSKRKQGKNGDANIERIEKRGNEALRVCFVLFSRTYFLLWYPFRLLFKTEV